MDSTRQVGEGADLVAQTGEALRRIAEQVVEINKAVGDMAASAEVQATELRQVNSAVGEVDQVTQQNAVIAEHSTAASQRLSREMEELMGLISRFQLRGNRRDAGVSAIPASHPQARRYPKAVGA
jgi:methyl-accepting chemotaxis protein